MERLQVPQGDFQLFRYPMRKREELRAWDAADEYLLKELAESVDAESGCGKVLVVNDGFGALSIALSSQNMNAEFPVVVLSDSYLSRQSIRENCIQNAIDINRLKMVSITDQERCIDGLADRVVLKIPKSLAELEELLYRIRPYVGPTTRLIAGGMAKNIHTSTLALFESIIGPTRTSLAVKKARLVFVELGNQLLETVNPFPKTYTLDQQITRTEESAKIVAHGGVFSHAGLDRGTSMLLEHMNLPQKEAQILDLGCGSGVLGLLAAMRTPGSSVLFVDESLQALESARRSVLATLGSERWEDMEYLASDCLEGVESESQDVVLNNPPFHQRGGQADHISKAMFVGSKRVLRTGGLLWVVGNRHLGYHKKLKGIFGNCQLVASNSKFVVLSATKH